MTCPLCGAPVTWRRTDLDGWVPCDDLPVLFTTGGRLRLLVRRELVDGCRIYSPKRDLDVRPRYAYMPHYYTCPVLCQERAEWRFRQACAARGWR